jgi:lysyl-tRNA synthetase class 2
MPSTVIRSFSYRPQSGELDVTFTTGRRYLYRNVPPEAAEALRGAFAKGRHFNRHIRGRYAFDEQEPADVADELNGR